jgi:hypothetical protein
VIQGGRIQKISLDQSSGLLFSLAANFSDHPTTEPQDDNSNFGKIIFLNLNTRNTEIFLRVTEILEVYMLKMILFYQQSMGLRVEMK